MVVTWVPGICLYENDAMNIGRQLLLWDADLNYSGYKSKSKISDIFDIYLLIFNQFYLCVDDIYMFWWLSILQIKHLKYFLLLKICPIHYITWSLSHINVL